MTNASRRDLLARVRALLEPGEIELTGIIVHTPFGREDELEMHEVTVEIGEVVATHAGEEDWYVYSGNDDPEFASNQHQGRRLADDGFVWECQQLLRDGSFDIVMYYESSGADGAIVSTLDEAGYDVTPVESTTPKS